MIYSNCDTSPPMIPMIPVTRLTGAAADGPVFRAFCAAGSRGRKDVRRRGEGTGGADSTHLPPPPTQEPPLYYPIIAEMRRVHGTGVVPASYIRDRSAISDYAVLRYDEKFGRKSEDRGPLSRGVETAEFGAAV